MLFLTAFTIKRCQKSLEVLPRASISVCRILALWDILKALLKGCSEGTVDNIRSFDSQFVYPAITEILKLEFFCGWCCQIAPKSTRLRPDGMLQCRGVPWHVWMTCLWVLPGYFQESITSLNDFCSIPGAHQVGEYQRFFFRLIQSLGRHQKSCTLRNSFGFKYRRSTRLLAHH